MLSKVVSFRGFVIFEAIKIAAFATLAAITYGILHDQITAHVCVEYFTVAHPPVFPTESPFWLAIGWGIIATWWVGLPLGIGLAIAARVGRPSKMTLADLRRPIIILMFASGVIAMISGAIGASLVAAGAVAIPVGWSTVISADRWVAFSFDAWAHLASYASGAIGGILIIGITTAKRFGSAQKPVP